MKKILLLTKNNPIEIYDVMMRLYCSEIYSKDTLFFSPQYTAMLAAQQVKTNYINTFYPALMTWEKEKENLLNKHQEVKIWVVVGTVESRSKDWYDAIIGLDNPEIEDYKIDETFNVQHNKYLTLDDSEIKFEDLEEVKVFISSIQKNERKEKKDEIQYSATRSN